MTTRAPNQAGHALGDQLLYLFRRADGIDPLATRRAEQSARAAAKTVSFSEAAKAFLAGNVGAWRNAPEF